MPEEVNKEVLLITRDEMISFMKCSDGKYHLIGEGFTSFSEAKNPKEYTRKYVNYKTEVTDVIGFAPSFAYSCDVISGDPVIEEIIDIHDNEKIGSAAVRDVVTVNHWIPGTTDGTFKASMRQYSIIPANKGDGTDALVYSGTLKARGDIVHGTFDVATSMFTPTPETTE